MLTLICIVAYFIIGFYFVGLITKGSQPDGSEILLVIVWPFFLAFWLGSR